VTDDVCGGVVVVVAEGGADGTALLASYTALVRKYEKEYPYVTGIDRFVARKK
jgi:hypothetical protein